MKKLLLLIVFSVMLTGCGRQADVPSASAEPDNSIPAVDSKGQVEISFDYKHRKGIASNQYAVWIENSEGEYIKTLFVTSFTAGGGWKSRPDALPVWVEKSGLSEKNAETVDAFTGATPKSGRQTYIWDCTDENGQTVDDGEYNFFIEGTIYWQDAVIYSGTLSIGGEENTVQAEAEFTTEEAQKSDMITGVEAVYKPYNLQIMD